MKKIILFAMVCLAMFSSANAQTVVPGAGVKDLSMQRNGKFMSVQMLLDLKELDVPFNRAVIFTPVIRNGNDSIVLSSVGVYGRNRYYYYQRVGIGQITGEDELSYRASKMPESVPYNSISNYEEWMEGATLVLNRKDFGCCSDILADIDGTLLDKYRTPVKEYIPMLVYVRPEAEEQKSRSLSGTAYIDFPVNITQIRPEYRNNIVELAKISGTIDSVNNDKDITIKNVFIKGFASPEGSWALNERLAKGRTEALKKYVQDLYKFAPDMITTSYEPEDWSGLRKYVESSTLAAKDNILDIIDSDQKPDSKEWIIKSKYPEDYRYLLANCYPALRHSDYVIDYVIRDFNTVDEIKEIMATAPHKLSLQELYILAQQYEAGSKEFNNVFETAVKMYPGDVTANLNAANAAMERKDLVGAERYLMHAGTSPQAIYARANLAAMQLKLDEAEKLFIEAKEAGIAEADASIAKLQELKR
ncbi:MAG: DUF3868 domain-containing protein [Bacteroidales bacterium]|nr:DUF3868 domain-containing protein [Bacteroidales bacterium]